MHGQQNIKRKYCNYRPVYFCTVDGADLLRSEISVFFCGVLQEESGYLNLHDWISDSTERSVDKHFIIQLMHNI